jgi:ABC-type phosphate transport system substrate-binding protein
MKRLLLAFLVGVPLLATGPHAQPVQGGFLLIVHPENSVVSLRPTDVSRMFLRKQAKWPNGQAVEPVDQAESSPTRRRFSDDVHGMDVPSVKGYWQEIVFSGRGEPPPERASDAAVVAFVSARPNAFGYVSPATILSGVKVLRLVR